MKKKIRFLFAAAAVTLLMAATGCGKPTPVSIAKDVVATLDKVKSIDGNMNLTYSGKISDTSASGVSMDMNMGFDLDYQLTSAPDLAGYLNGTVDISLLGMNVSTDMESYTVKEDNSFITYSKVEDQWTKETADDYDSEYDSLLQKDLFEAISGEKVTSTLEEKTKKFNDKDVYVLHVTLEGDFLNDFFSSYSDILGDSQDKELDIKDASVNLEMYVYKDANVPAKIVMDCKELGTSLFSGMDLGAEVDVKEFTITMTMNSYNTVDPIKVPEEAKNSAEESSDSDGLDGLFGALDGEGDVQDDVDIDEDFTLDTDEAGEATLNAAGNYVLVNTDGTFQAEIMLPEGYAYSESTTYSLYTEKNMEDYSLTLGYGFDDYLEMNEVAAYYGDNSYIKGDASYSAIQETPETVIDIGGTEVHYVNIAYTYMDTGCCYDCYAWIALPSGKPFLFQVSYFGYSDTIPIPLEELLQLAIRSVTFGDGTAA